MKPGQLASVWTRDSRRHKWRLERSMVLLLSIEGASVLVQTSDTTMFPDAGPGGTTGPLSFSLRGEGTWERELRPPKLLTKLRRAL